MPSSLSNLKRTVTLALIAGVLCAPAMAQVSRIPKVRSLSEHFRKNKQSDSAPQKQNEDASKSNIPAELQSAFYGSAKPLPSTLPGTLYDLKLEADGTEIDGAFSVTKEGKRDMNGDYLKRMAQILKPVLLRGHVSNLKKYYKEKQQCHASVFFGLPTQGTAMTPSFNRSENAVNGGCVVIYEGKVRAPETGTFRFVGFGDDLIAVRFNNMLVFEAGFLLPTHTPPMHWIAGGAELSAYRNQISRKTDPFHRGYERRHFLNNIMLMGGEPFLVKKGKAYHIQIIIADAGGGHCFYLGIENTEQFFNTKSSRQYAGNAPVYPFMTRRGTIPRQNQLECAQKYQLSDRQSMIPSFRPESEADIWQVVD